MRIICVKMIFFVLFLLVGMKPMNAVYVPAPYLKYVSEITKSTGAEMEKEFDLVYIGGGGRMPNDVEEIDLKFIAYRKGTIKEAREIEVTGTEKLVKKINEHENLRPYLREYPVKADRAYISVAFRKKDNTRYSDGSVALAFQARNSLFYRQENPNTENLEPLFQESYEEALKIVKNEH